MPLGDYDTGQQSQTASSSRNTKGEQRAGPRESSKGTSTDFAPPPQQNWPHRAPPNVTAAFHGAPTTTYTPQTEPHQAAPHLQHIPRQPLNIGFAATAYQPTYHQTPVEDPVGNAVGLFSPQDTESRSSAIYWVSPNYVGHQQRPDPMANHIPGHGQSFASHTSYPASASASPHSISRQYLPLQHPTGSTAGGWSTTSGDAVSSTSAWPPAAVMQSTSSLSQPASLAIGLPSRSLHESSLSSSAGSLDGSFGFSMPSSMDHHMSDQGVTYQDYAQRATTAASEESPATRPRLIPRDLGQRPSSSDDIYSVEEEDQEGMTSPSGTSRLDKRRNQNKLAQRAFRARTKVQTAETNSQVVQLMQINESQSTRLEEMAAMITALQQENVELKVAAGKAYQPLNVEVPHVSHHIALQKRQGQ